MDPETTSLSDLMKQGNKKKAPKKTVKTTGPKVGKTAVGKTAAAKGKRADTTASGGGRGRGTGGRASRGRGTAAVGGRGTGGRASRGRGTAAVGGRGTGGRASRGGNKVAAVAKPKQLPVDRAAKEQIQAAAREAAKLAAAQVFAQAALGRGVGRGRGRGRGGRAADRFGGRGAAGRGLGRAAAGRGAGKLARPGPMPSKGAWAHDMYTGPSPKQKKKNDLRAKITPPVKQLTTGTRVRVTNLAPGVTAADMKELFETVGSLKKVQLKKSGCEVTFARKADAQQAVQKFNGVTLDGTPMNIAIVKAQEQDSRAVKFTVTV